MKIAQVAVNVLRVPVDHPYVAGGRTVDANWHVLARITTSDGVEGIGYVVYPRPDLMTTIGHAARELGEHLIGMDVLEPEAAWDRLARRGDWVGTWCPRSRCTCCRPSPTDTWWSTCRDPLASSGRCRGSRTASSSRRPRPVLVSSSMRLPCNVTESRRVA